MKFGKGVQVWRSNIHNSGSMHIYRIRAGKKEMTNSVDFTGQNCLPHIPQSGAPCRTVPENEPHTVGVERRENRKRAV